MNKLLRTRRQADRQITSLMKKFAVYTRQPKKILGPLWWRDVGTALLMIYFAAMRMSYDIRIEIKAGQRRLK